MTSPNLKAETFAETTGDTAEAATTLLERLADRLGGKASVTTIYGEPVACEGVTIIPVARVAFSFGGVPAARSAHPRGERGAAEVAAPKRGRSASLKFVTGQPCSSPFVIRGLMSSSPWRS